MTDERRNAEMQFDELLVAYLDGELDSTGCREVEERLAADPDVRHRLHDLERTWAMLGELDATPVKESFARTTLEMVAVEAEKDLLAEEKSAPKKLRRALIWTSAAAVAIGVVGYFSAEKYLPNENRKLLENLPVVEKVDQYRQAGDVEFLRLLRKEGLFTKDDRQ